jgi:4-amino-4-deoxy-L-arabinose transferase-like glycosyltransferase
VILTINSAFSAAIAPAVYEIAWRCFGRDRRGLRVATWSGWLWALLPAASQYAVHWVWEMSLSTALLAWITVLALRIRGLEGDESDGEGNQGPGIWALFGLLWGLLALSNSSLLLFLPFCGLWMAWKQARRRFGLALRNTVVAAACCGAVISPWALRNYLVFHSFVPLRTNFGAELFESARFWNQGFPTMATLTPAARNPDYRDYDRLGEVAYSKLRGEEAKAVIRAHPGTFLFHAFKRFVFFWDGVPDPISNAKSLVSEVLREINYCFLSIAGILGLALALKRRVPGAWLFLWAFVSLPLVYYFISVQARFRHPLEPYIVILMVYLFQSAEPRRRMSQPVN